MPLYVIGDLHLSLGASKPMDIFGGVWEGYVEKIVSGFSGLTDEDVTVLCGDLSWGLTLAESLEDFRFVDRLPGKKYIIKGNHDYFWTTAAKMKRFFLENGLNTVDIIHNNHVMYDGAALCGTRGWFVEEGSEGSHDKKVFKREVMRLEASLKSAAAENPEEIIVFLHYPPIYEGYACREIIELLEKYGVRRCFYGHLHGASRRLAVQEERGGIGYRLISADNLNFRPLKII